jgi:hypothetical protein
VSDKKRSGWFYLFVGCGVLVLGTVIVVGVGAFMTIRWAEEMKDPELRSAKALRETQQAMGTDELPAGYHAEISLKAPFGFGTILVLTDGPGMIEEDATPEFEHLFIYIEGPGWDDDWKEFARGGDPPFDNMGELNINTRHAQVVDRGELTIGKMQLAYLFHRGEFSTEGFTSDGVFSVMLVRCPDGDKRSRTIVWGGPDVAVEAGDTEILGTVGDPERITEMMSHFQLCGA